MNTDFRQRDRSGRELLQRRADLLHRHSRRGLTLVEAMVAIAILVVMSGVVVESMRNSIEFHNLLSDRDVTVRSARMVLSKIRRDIQLAYLTPNRSNPDRFQTVFVGMDEEPDKLFFASLNHQRLYLDSRESDMTEITIWAERNDDGPGYTLYHREAPFIDEEPDEGGVVWPLAHNVRSFHLRYLDHQDAEWKEEWDTRSGDTPYRLPRAVEIGLVLIAPDPEDPTGERTVDVPFLTRVPLEYVPPLPNPDDPASVLAWQQYQGGFWGGGDSTNQNPNQSQNPNTRRTGDPGPGRGRSRPTVPTMPPAGGLPGGGPPGSGMPLVPGRRP